MDLALVFLLAAVIAVPVFKRFGLGAVLGYLIAGAAIGVAFQFVFDPRYGLIQYFLNLVSIPVPNFYQNSGWALFIEADRRPADWLGTRADPLTRFLWARLPLTRADVQIFHGVIRQMAWAAQNRDSRRD